MVVPVLCVYSSCLRAAQGTPWCSPEAPPRLLVQPCLGCLFSLLMSQSRCAWPCAHLCSCHHCRLGTQCTIHYLVTTSRAECRTRLMSGFAASVPGCVCERYWVVDCTIF